MITIDIASMHVQRKPYPGPMFRRTDADRKPARPVLRSNDGPGSIEERLRQSERLLAMAEAKKYRAQDADAYAATRLAQWHEERARVLDVLAAATIDLNLLGIARLSAISPDRAGKICTDLLDKGLITKLTVRNGRGGREVCISITEAGRVEHAGAA